MHNRYPTMIVVYFLLPLAIMFAWSWKYIDFARELVVFGAFCFFIVGWDIWATDHGSKKLWLWRFNEKTISGIKLFTQPIEEYFFAVCAPIWMILFWQITKRGFLGDSRPDALFAIAIIILGTIAGYIIYRWQTKEVDEILD